MQEIERTIAERAEPAPPGEWEVPAGLCPHCRRWEVDAEDGFCSSCGRLLLDLVLEPDALILVGRLTPASALTVRNTGRRARRAQIVMAKESRARVLIEPAGEVEIAAGETAEITIRLVEQSLPEDLLGEILELRCICDGDVQRALPLRVTVKSAPRPAVLTREIDFGELAEGKVGERQLRLRNAGGVPLKMIEVEAVGHSQLAVAEGVTRSRMIQPGEVISLSVLWDTRRPEVEEKKESRGFRLRFQNHDEPLFVPAKAQRYKLGLELDRRRILLEPALAKQDYVEKVRLRNTGTVDVRVRGVESGDEWIEVISRHGDLLLRRGGSTRGAAEAGAAGVEGCEIELVVHPQRLPAGRHLGKVSVLLVEQETLIIEVVAEVVHPEPSPDFIGIDFGTTHSVIAYYDEAAKDFAVVEDGGSPLIPSVLAFTAGAESYRIGREAKAMAEVVPDLVVRSIKRVLGSEQELGLGGRRFKPSELAARILQRLLQLAEGRLYARTGRYFDLRRAILTVPANFYDVQVRALLAACSEAGLEIDEELARETETRLRGALGAQVKTGILLDEPSAAALFYLRRLEQLDREAKFKKAISRKGGLNLLVYDHGGGTLDICVANLRHLKKGSAGLRILATRADGTVGGDAFDYLYLSEMLKITKPSSPGLDETLLLCSHTEIVARSERESWGEGVLRDILRARGWWKEEAERTKIALASAKESKRRIPPDMILQVKDGRVQGARAEHLLALTAERFHPLVDRLIARSVERVREALAEASLEPDRIDYVLHVGRQSLMPRLRERIRTEVLPNLPLAHDLLDPELLKVCVAKGAALYGRLKQMSDRGLPSNLHIVSGGQRLPHSYGIEIPSGLAGVVYRPLIALGTAYPCEVVVSLAELGVPLGRRETVRLYQNAGRSAVMESNTDLRVAARVHFDTREIEDSASPVSFAVDANRRLSISLAGVELPFEAAPLPGEESWLG